MEDLSLLGVFAHPGDESFGCGGIFAKYGFEGVRTGVVTATAGQAGLAAGYRPLTTEELAAIRVEELRCACRVLGVGSLHLLGYEDGHLSAVEPAEVEAKIVRILRIVRPLVVVTLGPEGGGSAHPDHQAISRYTTAAFFSAGDPAKFPEQLAEGLTPFLSRKLYYLTRPEAPDSGAPRRTFQPITTVIDISDDVEFRLAAFRCYRTQSGDYAKLVARLEQLGPKEYYHLAATTAGELLGREDDLFACLR